MKKVVLIILVALVSIAVLFQDQDSIGIKHIVNGSKHDSVFMVNDSMMQVHDTVINISHWIVPSPAEVEIFISDTVNLNTITYKDNGFPITKRNALIELGRCFFFDKTGNRKSSCEDSCHSLNSSGTGFTNKAQGGGMSTSHRNQLYEMWTGKKTFVELDKKPFKNFSVLNAHRLHEHGTILSHALEFDFPLEGQIGKAFVAHFVSDAVLQCQQVPLYNRISYSIFGRPLDEPIFKMAISAFEQTLTTYDNNINKIARGESNRLFYADAFVTLNSQCASCHQSHTKSKNKALNPVHDTVKATSLDLNNAYHKGYFHTSDDISFNRAVHKCSIAEGYEISMKEAGTIAASIRQNLTDKNYN